MWEFASFLCRHRVLVPLVLVVLCSCITELDVDLPGDDWSILVEGYMFAGDSAVVRVSETVPYFTPDTPDTSVGKGALVTLTYDGGSVLLPEVSPGPQSIYSYSGYPRGRLYALPATVFTLPQSGSIAVSVEYKGRTARAASEFPERVPIDSVSESIPLQDRYADAMLITARYPPGKSFYVVARFTEIRSVLGDTLGLWDFYGDAEMSGRDMRDTMRVESWTGISRFNSSDIVGYSVYLHRIPEEYYVFLQELKEQREGLSSPLGFQSSEPAEVHGNIVGGRGFFAAISTDTLRVVP